MVSIVRKTLVVVSCSLALGAVATLSVSAEDASKAAESAVEQAQPQTEAPAKQPSAGACPGMPGGGCCGSCQGKMALGGDAADGGGCPCQRARQRMREQGS